MNWGSQIKKFAFFYLLVAVLPTPHSCPQLIPPKGYSFWRYLNLSGLVTTLNVNEDELGLLRNFQYLPNALHLSLIQMLNAKNAGKNFLNVETLDQFFYSSDFKEVGSSFNNLVIYKRDIIEQFFKTNFCDLLVVDPVLCNGVYGKLSF